MTNLLNALPTELKTEIKSILTCYESVHVTKNEQTGEFDWSTCFGLGRDDVETYQGEIKASDVFANYDEWKAEFIKHNPNTHVCFVDGYKPRCIKRA